MKDVKVLCMRNKLYGFLAFILIFLTVAVSCAVSVDDPSVVYVPVSSGSGNPSFQGGGGTDGILAYGREGQDLDLQFNVSYPCVRSALPSDISALFSNPDVKFKASISKAGSVIANSTASKIVETALGVTTYKLAFSFPGFVSLYTTTYKITISLNDSETDAKLMETDEFEVTVAPNVKAYEDTANTYFLYPAADNALGPKGSLTLQVKSASDFSLDVSGLPAGVSVSSASGIHSIEGTDITPGNYEVLFTLSKDGNKVYSWKENIIVYSGLETNRWSSNSPSDPDPDSKDLTVLGRTEFYVRSATGATGSLWTTFSSDAGDDTDGDGSIKKPYATVQKAINTAKSLASTYAVQPEFTVYCDGSFGAYSGNTSASVIEVNTGVNDLRIIGLGSSRAEFNGTGVTKSVLFNSQKLYLENIWVKNGTSNSGGGMYLMGPTTMKNCKVSGCRATGSSPASGAGIFCVSGGDLKILEGVEICDNIADMDGGGIYVNTGCTLDICADVLLSGNEAGTGSAGIHVAGNIKANGALIENGLHPGLDHISGINEGGDVYHVSKNFMRINDPDLTDPDNNISRLYVMLSHINAPGLNVCLGKSDATETVFEINDELSLPEFDMTLMCTSFSESANKKSNRAVIKGYRIQFSSDKNYTLKGIKVLGSSDSGIYIRSNNVNLIHCDIESCEGSVGGFGGGGVYMDGGKLTMSYGSITGCSAPKGGALVMLSGAEVSLADVIVSGNTATGSGSGISYESGTLKLSGSTVITPDNDVYILSGKTITVESNLTGDCPVATITPSSYFPSNQVLASNAYLAGNYMKFAVTKQAGVKWKVVLTGSINRCSDDVCDLPSAPANGTYYVYDQEGLEKISEWVADGNTLQTCTFRLGNDIYAKGDFKPIGGGAGYNSNPFKGEFDGQDYTISGIDLTNDDHNYSGVFGTVIGGTVKNVTVEGVGKQGGLVGFMSGISTVENCRNRIAINSSKADCGGIVCAFDNGNIIGCTNEAKIKSSGTFVGGIVGNAFGINCVVNKCINNGDVEGNSITGGIAGSLTGKLINCLNEGNVIGKNTYIGGIAGQLSGYGSANVKNCQNKGRVYGIRYVGGIAGGINSSSYSLYMENTKNSGVVGRVSGDYSEFGSIFGGFGSTPITVYMKYNYYDNSVAPKTGTCSDLSAYPDADAAVGYAPMSRSLDSAVSVNGISYLTVNAVLNAWVNVENSSSPNTYLTWNDYGNLIFP